MATIISSSQFNPSNFAAPGVYVNNIPPAPYISGAATNVAMVVGTASWGPLNAPQIMSTPQDATTYFGGINSAALTDVHDMCTDATIAFQQGFISLYGCRVSDGTDTKASISLDDTSTPTALVGGTATALYSGIVGNAITVTIKASSITNYYDVTISSAIGTPDFYPRLPGTGFWNALATALSSGILGVAAPSKYIRLVSPNSAAVAPAVGTFTLTGGTDGRSAVTSAELIGQEATFPVTGIYAAASLTPMPQKLWVAGFTDTTSVATIQSFLDQNAIYSAIALPVGTSTSTALSTINSVGVHDYNISYLKDWVYWNDTANNVVRLVPPYGFVMGLITALAPSQSPLNKPVSGVVGTERNNPYTGSTPYSQAEIGQLENAGVLVITNPIPQGAVFGLATGNNTSLNTAESPVEYATMTNFLDQSFAQSLGGYVGQLQTARQKDPVRAAVRHELNTFLSGLQQASLIDQVVQLTCNFAQSGNPQLGINTPATIAAHYLYAYAAVRYLSSVRYFVMSLNGGTTVVSSSPTAPA